MSRTLTLGTLLLAFLSLNVCWAHRTTISLTYWLITVLICIQVMIRGSLLVGASALVGCALCYWGASAYMGSLLARRETRIGVLAVILIVAGQALMIWSGFMVRLFDIEIGGAFWALIGAASAIVVRVWDWMKLRPHTAAQTIRDRFSAA